MKRSGKPVKLVILIFFALFVTNTAAMYTLFGINIFKPVNTVESHETVDVNGTNSPVVNPGYNPEWNTRDSNNTYAGQETNGETGSDFPDIAGEEGSASAGGAAGIKGSPDSAGNDAGNAESGESTGVQNPKDFFLTKSQVAGLGKLDIKDKFAAVTAIAKVDGGETDRVYEMALDGVTYGELKEIETMLGRYLSPEEIDSLESIIEKSIKSNSGQEARPEIDTN